MRFVEPQELPAGSLAADAAATNLPDPHDGITFGRVPASMDLNDPSVAVIVDLEPAPGSQCFDCCLDMQPFALQHLRIGACTTGASVGLISTAARSERQWLLTAARAPESPAYEVGGRSMDGGLVAALAFDRQVLRDSAGGRHHGRL